MSELTQMSDKSSRSLELSGGIRQARHSQAPKKIEGSVFEFAFGPRPRSYFATSYPYHIAPAFNKPARLRYSLNLPTDLEEFLDEHKFIQNVAINKDEQWFVYYTPDTMRISQWTSFGRAKAPTQHCFGLEKEPRQLYWGNGMQFLMKRHHGTISTVAFGANYQDCFFMRLTLNDTEKWKVTTGPKVPPECQRVLLSEISEIDRVRACTFGCNDSWIVYGRNWNEYGGRLPEGLAELLEQGKKRNINKVVLNPYNSDEYVLIFDDGKAYGRFHRDFKESFLDVFDEWRREKMAAAPHNQYDQSDPDIDYYPPLNEDAIGGKSDRDDQLEYRNEREDYISTTNNISPQVTKPMHNQSTSVEEKITRVPTQQSISQQTNALSSSPPRRRGSQQQAAQKLKPSQYPSEPAFADYPEDRNRQKQARGAREPNPPYDSSPSDTPFADPIAVRKRNRFTKMGHAVKERFLPDRDQSQRPKKQTHGSES